MKKKLLTKNDYWEGRLTELLYNRRLSTADKKLAEQYIRVLNETKIDIVELYQDIMLNRQNDTVLISDLYKYDSYYKMLNNLTNRLSSIGIQEHNILDKELTQMYIDNAKMIKNQFGFSNPIDELNIKNTINGIWAPDGENWSGRIWKNKSALQERILEGLTDCVMRGDSKDKLVAQLTADFNVGFNQADRLVRTELSYVQNQSTLDQFVQAGVKKYKILPAHDARVCKVCKEIEGKVFPIEEAKVGVNYGPLHPNCRCAVLAVFE